MKGLYCVIGFLIGCFCSINSLMILWLLLMSGMIVLLCSLMVVWLLIVLLVICRLWFLKKQSWWCVELLLVVVGSVYVVLGCSFRVQIVRLVFVCEVQELGGGVRFCVVLLMWLVMQEILILLFMWWGICFVQNIVKCGVVILLWVGRFSQIWNSFSGFGVFWLSSGNIFVWMMFWLVVSYCMLLLLQCVVVLSELVWLMWFLCMMVMVLKL